MFPFFFCIKDFSFSDTGNDGNDYDADGAICNDQLACQREYGAQTIEYIQLPQSPDCCLKPLQVPGSTPTPVPVPVPTPVSVPVPVPAPIVPPVAPPHPQVNSTQSKFNNTDKPITLYTYILCTYVTGPGPAPASDLERYGSRETVPQRFSQLGQ